MDDMLSRNRIQRVISVIKATEEDRYFREDPSRLGDAIDYQATDHRQLKVMLDILRMGKDDVFVDIGCGKGRVACIVALQGRVGKVVGVELRKELADIARQKVDEIRPPVPVEIHDGDAALFRCDEGTVFYLFNPFGGKTVRQVVRNIADSFRARPRDIRIVYNNSVHAAALNDEPWLTREGEIPGTMMHIWRSIFAG